MRDINVVVLVGRLTRDSELKYTKSGMPIARFSVAVNRSRKQGEEWVDEVSYFDIDFWGKGAEAVNRYLTKGQQVGVEGELRQMGERMGNVEQGQRDLAAALRSGQHWLVGLVLGAWLTLGMGVVGLFLRGTP